MIPPPLSSRLILFTAYTYEGICFESIQPFKDFYCAEIRTDWKKKKQGLKIRGTCYWDIVYSGCIFYAWQLRGQAVGGASSGSLGHPGDGVIQRDCSRGIYQPFDLGKWTWRFRILRPNVNTRVSTRRSMLMPVIAEFVGFWVRLAVVLFHSLVLGCMMGFAVLFCSLDT